MRVYCIYERKGHTKKKESEEKSEVGRKDIKIKKKSFLLIITRPHSNWK